MILRRLLPYWRPAWPETLAGALLLIGAAGLDLLQPWPIKWLVDYVFGDRPPPAWLGQAWPAFADGAAGRMIIGVCLAIVAIAIAQKSVHLVSQFLLIRAGGRVVRQLRCRVSDHVHQLSLVYHDRTKVGDSIYRIAYDTAAAMTLISQAVAPIAMGVVILLGILVVMLRLDWLLAVTAVAVVPVFWITIRGFERGIQQRAERYHEQESGLVSTLQESLTSIRAVQAFTREKATDQNVSSRADRSLGAIQRLVTAQLSFNAVVGVAMGLGSAAVVGLGAYRVLGGHLTVGDILVFLAYLGMLYQPMNAFSQSTSVYHVASTQLRRVFNLLDTESTVIDRPDARTLPTVHGEVVFDRVSFSYQPNQQVLTDIDVQVAPGEVIAVVGPTGAGKSSLASLLLRFYDPTAGVVRLDGVDLRNLKLQWLRQQVGLVLQDAIIFAGTIRENIAYAKPGATDDQITRAARQAQADEFISTLPDGYNTALGERGVNLSGGQRQRLSIARAFLRDAPILVMDEPTSALDTETEQALMAAVAELTRGRTTFIIAHRLSTIRMADRILVLADGRVVEQGTHESLLETKTRYRRMVEAQWGARPVDETVFAVG